MKKHYSWLWFDADGTLFDYSHTETIALKQTFQCVNTPFDDQYLDIYRRINRELWHALEKREITSDILSVRRFELLIEALQLTCSPVHLSTVYLEQLALGTELLDGAYDLLDTLQANCRIAIVTNGFQAVQRSRMAGSSIRDYITELIISEEVGAAKPKVAFFEAASERSGNPDKSDILLIGDSLTADIQGGIDYGLDTCWYNPTGEPCPDNLSITYEIKHLRELLEIIE